ncbi:hemolysin [Paenibacillus selenitireducens]|uniref:Hemolysin n=1 Tax=Paenibacillus selenitireducens TaxID=1324314 RepID=A0A1T2X8M4_9BACL|nr:hemolysin family protein [Paenibacillus selenitireducens]OPA76224.1 hemolysin [Paenibacillus selenitireducens]
MFTEILILILLIVLNAFFAASEIALISLNDNKIRMMSEAGHKKAKLLQSLLSEPSRFLATIQIGITLAGFMASAFAADRFAGSLAQYFRTIGVPLPHSVLATLSMIVITMILSYFTLVLGELVPKRVAMQKSEAIAMMAVTPLTWLLKLSAPFVKLLTGSTNLIVRSLGMDPHDDKEQVTEEEIRMMVDVGKENGSIQEDEKMMINNIFELDDKRVMDIMTHRSFVVGIPRHASLQEVAKRVNEHEYTKFPVYDGEIDHIIGIMHVRDIMKYVGSEAEDTFRMEDILRTPFFIPKSKRLDDVLKEMKASRVHFAVVLDEYGGTAGIVTMEDVIEEIVGHMLDEQDEDQQVEKIERPFDVASMNQRPVTG